MIGGMTQLAIPAWEIVVRSMAIYLLLLLGLRLFGKREIGQFTAFDLVMLLLIANAVQPAMTGPDNSLLGGFLIISTLLMLNWVVSWWRQRMPLMRTVFVGHATIIGEDGRWIDKAMHREGIDIEDAEAALREHGVEKIEDTRLVVLEADGRISVVPFTAHSSHVRRKGIDHLG